MALPFNHRKPATLSLVRVAIVELVQQDVVPHQNALAFFIVFPGELHMWVLGLRQQRRFSIESMCRFSFVWGLGLFPAFPSYLPAYAPTRVKAKFSSGLGCADDDALGCLFACLGGLGLLPAHLFYQTTCPKHLGSQL